MDGIKLKFENGEVTTNQKMQLCFHTPCQHAQEPLICNYKGKPKHVLDYFYNERRCPIGKWFLTHK